MDACLRQLFCNADLIILGKDDSGLLFTVPQSDIMNFDGLRRMKISGDLLRVIPGAYKPVIRFPGRTNASLPP